MKYKIVGLWRTGSHYIEELIKQNFDLEFEKDMDMDNFNIHRHAHPHAMFDTFYKEGNIVVVITRNFKLWLESLRTKRHKWMHIGTGFTCSFQYQSDEYVSTFDTSIPIDEKSDEELKIIYDEFHEKWHYYSKKNKLMIVKYEELISNPEGVMKDIGYFYNIKWKGEMNKKVGELKYSDKFDPLRVIREKEFRHYDIIPKKNKKINLYNIYLERRKDRFDILQRRIENCNFKDLDITHMKSVDGTNMNKAELSNYGVTPYRGWNIKNTPTDYGNDFVKNRFWSRDVTMGEIGCSLGHIGMWERAKKDNNDISIFTEDDISFTKNWQLKFRLVLDHLKTMGKEWDMIYLGRARTQDNLNPDLPFDDNDSPSEVNNLVRPSFSYCLHGYAFSERGLNKVLEKINLLKENLFITDEYIPALYCKHPRDDINEMFGRDDFICYAMENESIKQDPKEAVNETDLGGSAI